MNHDPRLVENARQLRRALTPAEKLLWPELRGRRFDGYRFRRQHIVEPYIADFYCAAAALVIEQDGETHLGKEDEDRIRQAFLESKGLKVLRFWNTQVFDERESVLEMIYRECQERTAVSPPGGTRGAAYAMTRRLAGSSPLSPEGRGVGGEGFGLCKGVNPSPPTPLPSGERGERPHTLSGRGGRA